MIKEIRLSQKELQLIMYIREKLPYGEVLLITHNREPVALKDPRVRVNLGSNPADEIIEKQKEAREILDKKSEV